MKSLTRRSFLASAGASLAGAPLEVTDAVGEKVTVSCAGSVLLEYRYSAARPKTYVHPLCLPAGRPITLDGPEDHVHHRGLMVAWSEVNGVDFWGEINPAPHGRIVHRRFDRLWGGLRAEIVARNDWIAGGHTLLAERRILRVAPPSNDGVWLDWISELEAAAGPVTLAAGQHVYNGLGIRFVSEMNGGEVRNSNGAATVEQANGDAANWCAYFAAGAGVAFFNHPGNPRHPSPFFVMNKPFGYLSAAPTFREPFRLAPGRPIRFCWGVLAFSGAPRELDGRFAAWSRDSSLREL
jgi:hypothetical protein